MEQQAKDLTHLNALELRLSHERSYAVNDRTALQREIRAVWIAQTEREIAQERKFLGLPEVAAPAAMTDDELLAELTTP